MRGSVLCDAAVNLAGYILSSIGMLIVIGILSRQLSPDQFGMYFVLMILPSIFGSMDFGLTIQVTRSVARWHAGDAALDEVSAIFTIWLAFASALLIVGLGVIAVSFGIYADRFTYIQRVLWGLSLIFSVSQQICNIQ